MTSFSKNLEKYIYQSKLTENQLAKISGFNRSYIALMKNGQRISADKVRMGKLIDALNLSPYEQDCLWEDYLKARYGEKNFEMRQQMIAFIESFGHTSGIHIKSTFRHDIPDVQCVNNRQDLEYLIKAVTENESLKEKGKLKMIMQPDFDFIFRLLPHIYRNTGYLETEHIICFEGSSHADEGKLLYNLTFFKQIIPMILGERSGQYNAYYYYDNVDSHFATSVLMPYVIITSEYIINISVDLEHALVSKEPEVIGLYERLFDRRKRDCRLMIQRISADFDVVDYWNDFEQEGEPAAYLTVGGQPCFGAFDVESMLCKYIKIEHMKDAEVLLRLVKANKDSVSKSKTPLVSYFTKSGVELLMKEGLVEELPREIYEPVGETDRKSLIKMLIFAIRSGWYEGYLICEDKIRYPQELIITAMDMNDVNICYLTDEVECRFALREQSLSKIIFDFLRDLKESSCVYSKEETVAYLESLL